MVRRRGPARCISRYEILLDLLGRLDVLDLLLCRRSIGRGWFSPLETAARRCISRARLLLGMRSRCNHESHAHAQTDRMTQDLIGRMPRTGQWLVRDRHGGKVALEAANRRGSFISVVGAAVPAKRTAHAPADKARHAAASAVGGTASAPSDTRHVDDSILPHRGAVASSARLVLAEKSAELYLDAPPAEYAKASYWALPSAAAAAAAEAEAAAAAAEARSVAVGTASARHAARGRDRERSFLLMPVYDLNDEHYTVYWCRTPRGETPPAFCYAD